MSQQIAFTLQMSISLYSLKPSDILPPLTGLNCEWPRRQPKALSTLPHETTTPSATYFSRHLLSVWDGPIGHHKDSIICLWYTFAVYMNNILSHHDCSFYNITTHRHNIWYVYKYNNIQYHNIQNIYNLMMSCCLWLLHFHITSYMICHDLINLISEKGLEISRLFPG